MLPTSFPVGKPGIWFRMLPIYNEYVIMLHGSLNLLIKYVAHATQCGVILRVNR